MPPVGAFFAGAASFLTTGVVAGAGITGAWAAGAATASFLTTTVVGRLLTTVALSALSRAMAPKPKTPGLVTEASTTGEDASQAALIGWYATAGHHLCPPMTHGNHGKTKNAYLTYVVALSDIPGASLQRLIVNDQPVALATTPDSNGFYGATDRFQDFLWVKFYDGTQTAADPWLLTKYGTGTKQDTSVGRPWLSDMIGPGVCYAIVNFRYDRPRFAGMPKVLFEIMGAPLYDPRKDSTVGGSGAHRWTDPATWAPSSNPVVQVYNIMRGIQVPGSGVWGLGVPAADLPLSNWFAAMNVCDQLVDGEPQYRAGYEIRFEEEPGDVIEELLKACSGALSEVGGVWKVRAGGSGIPVYYFTDDDLVINDSATFTPFGSLNETFNGVTASYPEPEALWQPKEAPPRYNAAWEAADFNRRLVAALDLPACPYPVQVQRLMRAWIEDERRFRRHTLTLPPDAAILEPLDVVSWTSAENGYVEKTFEVVEIGDDLGTMVQRLALREVNAADYDWSPAYQIPWDTSPVAPDVPPDLAPDSFTVVGIEIRDDQNIGRRPALRLEWSEEDFELIAAVEWEVRRSGTTEVIATGTMNNPAARAVVVSAGLIGATSYEARIRYIAPGLTTLWTSWVTATTPDVRLTADDISTAVMQEIADAQAAADQAVADALAADAKAQAVRNDHDALVAGFTGTLAAAFADIEGDLTSITADISAFYDDATQQIKATALTGYYTKSGADGAISAAIDSFEAEFRDPVNGQIKATALTGYYTSAQTDSAISAASTTLQSNIDNVSSNLTNNYYTKAATDSAIAAESTVLQASIGKMGSGVINDEYLSGWVRWTTGGTLVQTANEIYPVGQTWDFTFAEADQGGLWLSGSPANIWTGQSDADAYIVEVEFTLVSGTLDGMRILFDWNVSGGEFRHEQKISDIVVGPSINGRSQIARGVFKRPANFSGTFTGHDLYIMGNFGTPKAAKRVKFHRVSVSVDPVISNLQATVTTQGTAIADLQTGASAGYLIKAQAGGAVSLIDLIAADGGGGTPTSIVKISADDILLDGSVAANKLVVGLGKNLLDNSNWKAGTVGWYHYKNGAAGAATTFVIRNPGLSYTGITTPTATLYQNTGDTTGYSDIESTPLLNNTGATTVGFPVSPGQRLEASAYVWALRCSVEIRIRYYDATGASLAFTSVLGSRSGGTGTQNIPDSWSRIGGFSTVPASAASASIHIRKLGTDAGQTNSYLFIHKPQLAVAHDGQTEFAPWSPPGTTLIDGGQVVANSITADKMVAGTITAASGIIADAAIANAKIANGAITTAKIGDLQVNTIKIANNAITSLVATEISSGSATFSFTATVGTYAVVFATFRVAISTWFNSENSNGEYYDFNVTLNGKSIGGGVNYANNTSLSPFWQSFAIPVQITQSSNTITVSGAIVSTSSKVGLGALKVLK